MHTLMKGFIKARQARKLSQAELAAKAGLSRMAVQKMEAGTTDPRLSSLLVLARAMDLELMLVPSALRQDLEAFARAGGRVLGQAAGIDAPGSVVDELLSEPRKP